MDTITLDFEAFFSTEYSLSKMSTIEYILDPRWETQLLTVKKNNGPTIAIDGPDAGRWFAQQSENVMAISHNALFDMSICAWRYGWVPKVMVDTLGVSRALLQAQLKSLSLGSVAEHLGVGVKDKGALANVKNMRLDQIKMHPDIYRRWLEYGIEDTEICYRIFCELVKSGKFPPVEIAVMDAVLRCVVQPKFVANTDVLHQSLAIIKAEKQRTLDNAMAQAGAGGGLDMEQAKKQLMSGELFAQLLRDNGVDPPTKISGTTGKETYAFAKSDQDFLDLLEHPNIAVQTLVGARLGHKSTIEESRHERFIKIANLDWPATKVTPGGNLKLMPMPLRYSGAHTHRLSGDWKLNVQNMGRGSMLRQSLEAPEGYTVVAGDESQVEARFVVTLCEQEDVRLQFANKQDVYSLFATDLFGFPVTKANKVERFIGKQCILGLGFQLGHVKFTGSIPILAWNQLKIKMPYTLDEGKKAVDLYRTKNAKVKATWKLLAEQGIHSLFTGDEWQWGPVLFRKEEILLPNGMSLYYHNLRQQAGGKFGMEWVFNYGFKTKRAYGGMLLENIVQALARIITMEAAVRIRVKLAKLGIQLALQVHDELVFVVKHEHVAVVKMLLEHELRQRPWWLPNLPLDCEIGSGPNYGDAK